MRLRVGLLGIGKIARDQHIPAINANPGFDLAACASRNATVTGVPSFPDLDTMLGAVPDLHCISICTPPQAHFEAALTALRAGKHVMLEKPPTATTRQIALLADEASRRGRTLFQTWHSRFAAGVDAAREWLRTRKLVGGRIIWKEDVHFWHPGQRWIWEPGGFGVFDPGINALSVLTAVLSREVCVESALLEFPENQQAPIAAQVRLRAEDGVEIGAEFDFRQKGEQSWDIELRTTTGSLKLSKGGAELSIDGTTVTTDESLAGEYPRLYQRFA
jgi:predicted dehydrogenase